MKARAMGVTPFLMTPIQRRAAKDRSIRYRRSDEASR
jgi:hypothetical protein